MGVCKYLILLWLCGFCATAYVKTEASACTSHGISGTCVSLNRCGSAALSQIYRDAGYDDDRIAQMPEVCSTDNVPKVCCTDCNITKEEVHKSSVVGPGGVLLEKTGSKARDKCLEYFQRLPYSCRGVGNVKMERVLNQEGKCHEYNLAVSLSPGGIDAKTMDFPHVVLLGYGKSDDAADARWFCGGFIISERYILTAAHCINAPNEGKIKFARYAIKKRSDPQDSWKVMKIKNIISHPETKLPSSYHDIALLETETEFEFDQDCLPACLDVDGVEKSTTYLSGFGLLKFQGELSDTLKVVELHQPSDAECDKVYPPHRRMQQGVNHTITMCYRANENEIGSCQGDGGSPIQVIEQDCLYTAVGIVSLGRRCGSGIDLYTRISHYVPWIESIVWP